MSAARSGGCPGADWLRGICYECFIWSRTNAVYVTTGSTCETFRSFRASKEPKREFKVGDKIRVNLHHGKIEDVTVKAVIDNTDGLKLQVDVIGIDLTALIGGRQVSSEVTSLNP